MGHPEGALRESLSAGRRPPPIYLSISTIYGELKRCQSGAVTAFWCDARSLGHIPGTPRLLYSGRVKKLRYDARDGPELGVEVA